MKLKRFVKELIEAEIDLARAEIKAVKKLAGISKSEDTSEKSEDT